MKEIIRWRAKWEWNRCWRRRN